MNEEQIKKIASLLNEGLGPWAGRAGGDPGEPDALARALGAEVVGPAPSGGAAFMSARSPRPGSNYPSAECPDCQGRMAPIIQPDKVEWMCLDCDSRFDQEYGESQIRPR